MALYRVRHVWTPRVAAPSDKAVWSWGVESATDPDATALKARFITAMSAGLNNQRLIQVIKPGMRGYELAVYPAAGGAAVSAINTNDIVALGNTAAFPGQCAAVVSAQINAARGVQPKGRTYYGPLSGLGSDGVTGGLSVAGVTTFGNFSLSWHAGLLAEGCTPVVLSGDGLVKRGDIVSYAIDNSYDVQRSRQYERTAVTYFNP